MEIHSGLAFETSKKIRKSQSRGCKKYGFDEIALTKGNLRYKEVSFTMVFREKLSINKFINEYGRSSQRLTPNGKLEIILLKYWSVKKFSDTKTNIESRLSEIAAKIITVAEDEYQKHIIREEEKLEKKEETDTMKLEIKLLNRTNDILRSSHKITIPG